jgi:hypothetical protein
VKRRTGKAKSVSMMGKSNEPFARKAKKPEGDDKPHVKPGAPSTDRNARSQHSKRTKRLTGLML